MLDEQESSPTSVAFFDIDGTLYRDNFSSVLMQHLYKQGKIDISHYQGLEKAFTAWQARKGTYDEVSVELLIY